MRESWGRSLGRLLAYLEIDGSIVNVELAREARRGVGAACPAVVDGCPRAAG